MRKHKRWWWRALGLSILTLTIAILALDRWVSTSVTNQIYTDTVSIPHKKIGLLLGTSKYIRRGWVNLYYKYRIDAAVSLYKGGKVDYILISGDNRRKDYNEPETMQSDLIAAGVPPDHIVLDYAGFRTLDSILRCKKVFDEDDIIIISQRFHDERALFIANHKKLKAIAYAAHDVPVNWSIRVQLREKLARVKMAIDLIFDTAPHFYVPK